MVTVAGTVSTTQMVADTEFAHSQQEWKESHEPRKRRSKTRKEGQSILKRSERRSATRSRENLASSSMAMSESESVTSTVNSSTTIPVFASPKPSCHWAKITWKDVKAECNDLINEVEGTMRDNLLTTAVYTNLHERKRALQTAMRRRNRIPDEVWLCYRALQITHEDVINGNSIADGKNKRRAQSAIFPVLPFEISGLEQQPQRNVQSQPIDQEDWENEADATMTTIGTAGSDDERISINSNGDAPRDIREQMGMMGSSCLDILSSTLIRCGLELELYDEETNSHNRMAKVGLGIAVFVAICTVVYYC